MSKVRADVLYSVFADFAVNIIGHFIHHAGKILNTIFSLAFIA